MQKRTMKNTFSNKGESYIPVCVLVLFLSALVSVLILYIGTMAQVQAQKRDVKTKLDSVVSEYATEMFDAIKQGAPSEQYIDYDGLVRKTYARLGFPSDTVLFMQSGLPKLIKFHTTQTVAAVRPDRREKLMI